MEENDGLPYRPGWYACRRCRRRDVCRRFVQPIAGFHALLAYARTAGAKRRHSGGLLVPLGALRRLGLAPLGSLALPLGPGPVAIFVGIDWRVFGRHEAIRSCGEVNDLIVWFLGEL